MSGIIGKVGSKSGVIGVFPSLEVSAFRGSLSSSVAVNYDTYAVIAMNDEAFDIDNSYDMTTGRFTAKKAGKYFAQGQLQINVINTTQFAGIMIKKNGANQDGAYRPSVSSSATTSSSPSCSTIFSLEIGDYLELFGGASFTSATTYGDASLTATFFSIIKI